MLPFFSYEWIIICRSDGQFVGDMKYSACKWQKKTDAG